MGREREERERQDRSTDARAWAEKQDRRWEPTAVRLPEGVKRWKPSKVPGVNMIDVIQYYVVCGEHDRGGNPSTDRDFYHFERTYYIHGGLGPEGKDNFICSKRVFKDRCYVCGWADTKGRQADDEVLDRIRDKARILMNVIDVTNAETRKEGIQILDEPFGGPKNPWFGQLLKTKIHMLEKYAGFSKPEGGYTLILNVEENVFKGNKGYKVTSIDMERREEDYKKSIREKAYDLDSLLIETPYEKMRKLAWIDPEEIPEGGAAKEERKEERKEEPPKRESRKEEEPKRRPRDEDDAPPPRSRKDEDEPPRRRNRDDEDEDRKTKANDDEPPRRKRPDPEEDAPKRRKEEDDLPPKPKREPTADDLGLEADMMVVYEGRKCEIMRVSADGTSLTLEDPDGKAIKAVAPSQVERIKKAKPPEDDDDAPPARKPTRKEEDDDAPPRRRDDDDPPPRSRKEEPPKNKRDEELADDDNDSPFEDDDPPPRRRRD